jgi:hypothetical protein
VLEEDVQTLMAITTMMTTTMMGMIMTRERGQVEVAVEVEEGAQLHRRREKLQLLEGKRVRQGAEERRGPILTTVMMILVSLGPARPKRALLTKVDRSSASSQAVKTLRWRRRW